MLFGTVHAGNFQPDTLGNDPDLTIIDGRRYHHRRLRRWSGLRWGTGLGQISMRFSASVIHGLGDVVFDLP